MFPDDGCSIMEGSSETTLTIGQNKTKQNSNLYGIIAKLSFSSQLVFLFCLCSMFSLKKFK